MSCPDEQQTIKFAFTNDEKTYKFVFPKAVCDACPLKPECTTNKNGRTVQFSVYHEILENDKAFLKTAKYETTRKARWGQEGDYRYGKRCFGLSKTRYRGLKKIGFQNRMIFLL